MDINSIDAQWFVRFLVITFPIEIKFLISKEEINDDDKQWRDWGPNNSL